MRLTRLAIFSLALSTSWTGYAAAAPMLVPHRAVYDIALDKASDRSGVTGLTGRMVYEFNGSPCEGYTVKFRFVTRIETGESTRVTDQQTTTYEDGDGKNFSFATKSFVDQQLEKEVKGSATMGAEDLAVAIDKPESKKLDLAKTQFPTQHLAQLIENAETGKSFYETTLFDGSEDADKVMTTTVIVGKRAETSAADPESPALANAPKGAYWPVDIAYFDPGGDGGEEVPSYRVSFKLHENGITRDMLMDYGDFSITGKLINLSVFDTPKTAETCTR